MKRKVFAIGLALIAILAIIGVGVAYFTGQVNSQGIFVTTGSISIDTDQFSTTTIDNLMPGEERQVDWVVSNTGSSPIYLKGKIDWVENNPQLFADLRITSVEADVNGVWQTLVSDPTGIMSEFFYSVSGGENDLYIVGPGDQLPMRMTLELDANVGDELQLTSGELSIHLAAKQTAPGAIWPMDY